jgi:hypothetical protein
MEHRFAYPTVRPLQGRSARQPLTAVAPDGHAGLAPALSSHRSRIEGNTGASVRSRMQPAQTPRP